MTLTILRNLWHILRIWDWRNNTLGSWSTSLNSDFSELQNQGKGGIDMYKNILVPVTPDHERSVADAIDISRRLRADGGKITLLSVIEQMPAYVVQYLPEG